MKKPHGYQQGQNIVEFSLILALITIVVFLALNVLGLQSSKAFSSVTSQMAGLGF